MLASIRNVTLIFDEARVFLKDPSVNMVRLFRAARHYGVETIVATQRLIDIHPDIRATFTDLILFHVSSFRDLAVLAEELPDKKYLSLVQTLPALYFLYVDKQHGIIERDQVYM